MAKPGIGTDWLYSVKASNGKDIMILFLTILSFCRTVVLTSNTMKRFWSWCTSIGTRYKAVLSPFYLLIAYINFDSKAIKMSLHNTVKLPIRHQLPSQPGVIPYTICLLLPSFSMLHRLVHTDLYWVLPNSMQ